jgi:hypothetical protein
MKKKWLALALAFVALSILAACASTNYNDNCYRDQSGSWVCSGLPL